MYCGNCGMENEMGAKFCKKCGAPLEEKKMMNNTNWKNEMSANAGAAAVSLGERVKALPKKVVLGACAAVLGITVVTGMYVNARSTVDLNKYMTVEAVGYDGYGTAKVSIDWKAIKQKYGDKISYTEEATNQYGRLLNFMEPIDSVKESVHVKLDQNSRLANGDEIAYTWRVDDELSKYVKCKVKCKDGTYKVSGLEEVGSFDAFADLTVEFTGIAPNGSANLNYTGTEMNYYDFSSDNKNGLSNGDKVTVSIDESRLERYANKLGKVPETLEKVYTVEGLDSYLTKGAEIDSETLNAMTQQAEDTYQAYAAKSFGDGEELQSLTYIGNYLLTAKNPETRSGKNALYLVYKAQVKNHYSNGTDVYDKVNDIYWYMMYSDLLVGTDGKVKVDVNSYKTPGDRMEINSGIAYWFSTIRWSYAGYPTLDELYKKVVISNVDAYNHEDHVEDTTVQAENQKEEPAMPISDKEEDVQ